MWWKTLGGDLARYFIARLPNWRQISGASRHGRNRGRNVAKRREQPVFISTWAIDPDMTAKPSHLPVKRILLAEDDESMRGFLERALIKAGYEVIAFANGKEAHERLKEEPFSLLLTDIVMPQMDGIELARLASELDPEIKIMFITGFAAVTLNTNSRAPKNARVLSKPFHLKDLVREIDRLLAI
jgi:two-component system, cell cycle response regulator CpdR